MIIIIDNSRQVIDTSLADIKFNLNPSYSKDLIARSGQFSGDKTKYSALPRAASSNLQAPHKRGESDIFNQRLLYRVRI
jgi:hypothetical protein